MKTTKQKVDAIISIKDEFLTIIQYDCIKEIIDSNEKDLFFSEIGTLPKELENYLMNSEMYYGFTEKEVKDFLEGIEKLGYTFDFVNIATQDNGEFTHTFKPYNLRKI